MNDKYGPNKKILHLWILLLIKRFKNAKTIDYERIPWNISHNYPSINLVFKLSHDH